MKKVVFLVLVCCAVQLQAMITNPLLSAAKSSMLQAVAKNSVLGAGMRNRKSGFSKMPDPTTVREESDPRPAGAFFDSIDNLRETFDGSRKPSSVIEASGEKQEEVIVRLRQENCIYRKKMEEIQEAFRKTEVQTQREMAFFGALLIGQASPGSEKARALARINELRSSVSGRFVHQQRKALDAMEGAYALLNGRQIAEAQVAWYQLREKIHGNEGFESEDTCIY